MSEPILFAQERRSPRGQRRRLVEVVGPVYNEQHVLERSVRGLHDFLKTGLSYDFVITIADNAGTDRTWDVARRLADALAPVRAVHMDRRRRAGHCPAAVGAQRPRHRVAGGARSAHGPRPQAGDHLALLQPAAVRRDARPVLQCPMRVQGGPDGGRPGAAARRRGRGVVSSTPSCCCSPNESACGCERLPRAGRRTSAQRGRELNPAGDVISEFVDEFPPHRG
ncbi:glycosyltransferase [Actinomadura nitritigenes]|uniref:glycosyltransferase n=1 Tax=Actinomadura nitritigenes TaxID=134602 RepID=UPI003D8BD774